MKGGKKMLKNYTYLTEQDLEDGKELAQILSQFNDLDTSLQLYK